MMQNTRYKFMNMFRTSGTIYAVVIAICIGSFVVRGLSQSIDFTGGWNYVVTVDKNTHMEEVRNALDSAFQNTTGKNTGKPATTTVIAIGADDKIFRVSTNYNLESNDPQMDDQAETILYTSLEKAGLVKQSSIEAFRNPDVREGGSIISSSKVGPSIAKDITSNAIRSVVIAPICIFLYILLRFRNTDFSIDSVAALTIGTMIVVGLLSLCYGWIGFSLEIDQTFIGATLTVIGYDIDDPVVVFDRIRENLKLHPKQDIQKTFNNSINQTLTRTINTSVSILIVLVLIFIPGAGNIRSFTFAMIIGIFVGALSSVFSASPIAYLVLGRKIKKEQEEEAVVVA